MNSVSNQNFGLLIAYGLPGFLVVLGIAPNQEYLNKWLKVALTGEMMSLSGMVLLTLAAVFAGLTTSTFRWLLIDRLHHATGIKEPKLDFKQLGERYEGFEALVEGHYRYYQFYANSLIAIPVFCSGKWSELQPSFSEVLIVVCIWLAFFRGSRDTLGKYYVRSARLLCQT